jgi:dTDP-4-amino-4,6-dideoxygalactose transaminase
MAKLAIRGGPRSAEGLGIPPWPPLEDEDRRAVMEALESRRWCRIYPESRTEQFEAAFAQYQDARHAVAVSNGTVAIELARRTWGAEPGDEVLVPAVTFIASASAIPCVGAVPIFVDSDPDTLAISADGIAGAITERTRGAVGVHYGGYPIDFDAILPVLRKRGLFLVEDCAHAHGTEWKGHKVGAIGTMGAFSLQESKSLTSGEGGVVLTDSDELAELARLIHNIGRVIGRPGYEHHVLASNYRMNELEAALLLSAMRRLPELTRRKHENGEFLAAGLREIGGIDPLPRDPRITQRGYYFFIAKYDAAAFGGVHRDRFLDALAAEGVPCGAGYAIPLYRQPCFAPERVRKLLPERLGPIPDYQSLRLPVAERFCGEQQVTLPHPLLLSGRAGLQKVIDAAAKIKANLDELRAHAQAS